MTAVVASRAERSKVRRGICTTVSALDDVVDDQASTSTAADRGAIERRAFRAVSGHDSIPEAPPLLSAVITLLNLQTLARAWSPTGWLKHGRPHRHALLLQSCKAANRAA